MKFIVFYKDLKDGETKAAGFYNLSEAWAFRNGGNEWYQPLQLFDVSYLWKEVEKL